MNYEDLVFADGTPELLQTAVAHAVDHSEDELVCSACQQGFGDGPVHVVMVRHGFARIVWSLAHPNCSAPYHEHIPPPWATDIQEPTAAKGWRRWLPR